MSRYRNALPQLDGGTFLADGGVETDLIFNQGIEIPHFAAHTLLSDPESREVLANYFRRYLQFARDHDAGYILDSQTWKAHLHWAEDLGVTERELREINHESIRFISSLRDEFPGNNPIILNAVIGPRGDAYAPEHDVAAHEAEDYHAMQIGWLAETEVDMVTALTFTQSDEAIGAVRAASAAGLPVVISFTTETDGRLPNGENLSDAIRAVDDATDSKASYFMVNCAHPDHFSHVLEDGDWSRRVRGLRCNASRRSHAELDESETLDDGNPDELAEQYKSMVSTLPWVNVFGGCCGTDYRHIARIADIIAD